MDVLKVLLVGAGTVGHEKLHFLFKSSPNAQVRVIASCISEDVASLTNKYSDRITLVEKNFEGGDVMEADIVIAATNNPEINMEVYRAAKLYRKLVNVADTPLLCDFYMGSIVTRGDLKIAISTNGKSPTFAKRFRQLLEKILPAETGNLVVQLRIIRDRLSGNFENKVKELNRITESLIQYHD